MAETAWTKPGSGANVAGGDETWSSPTRITADNGLTADTGFLGSLETSDYLYGDNFGFSLSTSATIDGVEFRFERSNAFSTDGDIEDHTVQLVNASAVRFGNNKAVSGTWPGSLTLSTVYGGSTDLWGTTTLTPELVNDPDFGVQVRCEVTSGFFLIGSVDYFELKIHYTAPASLDLEGFRIRNDDGNESSASWRQAQDVDDTIGSTTTFRIRFLVDATGDPDAGTFTLQAKGSTESTAFWQTITT